MLGLVASELSTYGTKTTDLSATQINRLPHITSWSLVNADQNNGVFCSLFAA